MHRCYSPCITVPTAGLNGDGEALSGGELGTREFSSAAVTAATMDTPAAESFVELVGSASGVLSLEGLLRWVGGEVNCLRRCLWCRFVRLLCVRKAYCQGGLYLSYDVMTPPPCVWGLRPLFIVAKNPTKKKWAVSPGNFCFS